MERLAFHGLGLHSGELCSLTLDRDHGPARLRVGKRSVELAQLKIFRTDLGVQVGVEPEGEQPGFRVDLVEHLFGALAGLQVEGQLEIRVRGPELPLLDGGALELSQALLALELPASPPRLQVLRAGELHIGTSRYILTPAEQVNVTVQVDFRGVGEQCASWDGTRGSFLTDIAPARTFGYRADHAALSERGRARHVDKRSVMVLTEAGEVEPPGRPMGQDELARHKLLDLLGDLYLGGGAPLGSIRAEHPGHTSNHRLLQAATDAGLIGQAS